MKLLAKLTTLLLFVCCSTNVLATTKIKNLRLWPSPDSVRVVFDLEKSLDYKIYTLESPHRVVIDFKDADFAGIVPTLTPNNQIKKIRFGTHPGITRAVFDISSEFKPTAFILNPNENYGHRLVVDFESINREAILALFDLGGENNAKTPLVVKKDFVIAIDPGHGGEDPGAIGARGTREKDIVLQISRKLVASINKQQGKKAFLTRTGDYYIGLRERTRRARARDADLFISMHADAFRNRKANGASVFILSSQGSSSEAARWLAEKENRSDLIGGIKLNDKGDMLAQVLLDLSQTANQTASMDVAKQILNNLGSVTTLHKGNLVERAGFAVLKSPDIPSILVETGFISNIRTERMLKSPKHQQKLADALSRGVNSYFQGQSKHVIQKRNKPTNFHNKFVTYKVKKGDSLAKISAKYNVKISKIKQQNQLKSDNIKVGQVLKIKK